MSNSILLLHGIILPSRHPAFDCASFVFFCFQLITSSFFAFCILIVTLHSYSWFIHLCTLWPFGTHPLLSWAAMQRGEVPFLSPCRSMAEGGLGWRGDEEKRKKRDIEEQDAERLGKQSDWKYDRRDAVARIKNRLTAVSLSPKETRANGGGRKEQMRRMWWKGLHMLLEVDVITVSRVGR